MNFAALVRVLTVCLALLVPGESARAHDPSAYGGLFRSRDFGRTWLNADVGLFLGGAVALSVNPMDPNHLLLGTDVNLLVSRNGGREWKPGSPEKLFGAVTAVAFLPGGEVAICSTPAGLFRSHEGTWQRVEAPREAAPARSIVPAAPPGRIYLLGRRDLYVSEDAGRHWQRVEHTLPDQPEFTELVVAGGAAPTLFAIVDGKLMASEDGGINWRTRGAGLPDGAVQALSTDPVPGRLWIAAADRLYTTDDGGFRWTAAGQALPEEGTSVRGIAADTARKTIVVSTHRGLYRSEDGANTWLLLEDNLPVHLEAKPLLRDPANPGTLYAGYSLMPYGEIWRRALEGGNLLARLSIVSLAGGVAFLLLLAFLGFLLARWLAQRRGREPIAGGHSTR